MQLAHATLPRDSRKLIHASCMARIHQSRILRCCSHRGIAHWSGFMCIPRSCASATVCAGSARSARLASTSVREVTVPTRSTSIASRLVVHRSDNRFDGAESTVTGGATHVHRRPLTFARRRYDALLLLIGRMPSSNTALATPERLFSSKPCIPRFSSPAAGAARLRVSLECDRLVTSTVARSCGGWDAVGLFGRMGSAGCTWV